VENNMTLTTITNITDYIDNPDTNSIPHILDIYGTALMPGDSTRIDVDLLNDKIQALVDAKYIVVGALPDYYVRFKNPPQKTQEERILEKITEEIMEELEKKDQSVDSSPKYEKRKNR
jgi:hypothetical protein